MQIIVCARLLHTIRINVVQQDVFPNKFFDLLKISCIQSFNNGHYVVKYDTKYNAINNY